MASSMGLPVLAAEDARAALGLVGRVHGRLLGRALLLGVGLAEKAVLTLALSQRIGPKRALGIGLTRIRLDGLSRVVALRLRPRLDRKSVV